MKKLSFFISTMIIACILFACTNNSSPAAKTNTSDPKTSSSDAKPATDRNLTGTDGSFSYTINGQRVETSNYVQHANLFINEVSNDAADNLLRIKVTTEASNVFDFTVANSGTTTINGYHPDFGNKTKGASYMDGKTYRNLYAVSVTVTITSISDSRVTGTFSGTFKADESDGGATANVTDGSFNLPFMKN